MVFVLDHRYIEVRTPLELGDPPIRWLADHGFEIRKLNDIRSLLPETGSGAMRHWMNGHPELPDSDTMPARLWAILPTAVIRCHHYANETMQDQLWWFPPDQRDLAMLFKLAFA